MKGERGGTDSKLIVGGLRFVRLRVSIGFYPESLAMRERQEENHDEVKERDSRDKGRNHSRDAADRKKDIKDVSYSGKKDGGWVF